LETDYEAQLFNTQILIQWVISMRCWESDRFRFCGTFTWSLRREVCDPEPRPQWWNRFPF